MRPKSAVQVNQVTRFKHVGHLRYENAEIDAVSTGDGMFDTSRYWSLFWKSYVLFSIGHFDHGSKDEVNSTSIFLDLILLRFLNFIRCSCMFSKQIFFVSVSIFCHVLAIYFRTFSTF